MASRSLSEWRGSSSSVFSAPVFANFLTMTMLCPGSLELLESSAALEKLGRGNPFTAGENSSPRMNPESCPVYVYSSSLGRQGRRWDEGAEIQTQSPAQGSLPLGDSLPFLHCLSSYRGVKVQRVDSGACHISSLSSHTDCVSLSQLLNLSVPPCLPL